MDRVLVVAGNYRQFRYWLEKQEHSWNKYVYIGEPHHAYGYSRETPYIVVGSFTENAFRIRSKLEKMGHRELSGNA